MYFIQAKPPLPVAAQGSRDNFYKSPGVFPEDFFRCMTENKQISKNYQKSFKGKHDMAMSRFETEAKQSAVIAGPSAKFFEENPGLAELAKRLMLDPEIDEAECLSLIKLPAETMYLIDKVVRLKARTGPIGIDNSELINLEFENEFKAKHKHILKLNDANMVDEDEQNLQQYKGHGYTDENGVFHSSMEDQRLFQQNEKLLQRLTFAVYREAGKPTAMHENGMDDDMNAADETQNTEMMDAEATSKNVQDLISQQLNGGGPTIDPLNNRKNSRGS